MMWVGCFDREGRRKLCVDVFGFVFKTERDGELWSACVDEIGSDFEMRRSGPSGMKPFLYTFFPTSES
jgi:hypothetical protein